MIDWYFAGKNFFLQFSSFLTFLFFIHFFSFQSVIIFFVRIFRRFCESSLFRTFCAGEFKFWHLIGFSSDLEYQWVSNRVKIAPIWAIWKKAKFNMRVDVWLCDGLEKCWAKIKDSLKLCRMRQLGLANFWAIFSPPFLVTLYSVWIRDEPPNN